jgi:hypothetical protein
MLINGFGVTEVVLSTLVHTCEARDHQALISGPSRAANSHSFHSAVSVGTKYLGSCTVCGPVYGH